MKCVIALTCSVMRKDHNYREKLSHYQAELTFTLSKFRQGAIHILKMRRRSKKWKRSGCKIQNIPEICSDGCQSEKFSNASPQKYESLTIKWDMVNSNGLVTNICLLNCLLCHSHLENRFTSTSMADKVGNKSIKNMASLWMYWQARMPFMRFWAMNILGH